MIGVDTGAAEVAERLPGDFAGSLAVSQSCCPRGSVALLSIYLV